MEHFDGDKPFDCSVRMSLVDFSPGIHLGSSIALSARSQMARQPFDEDRPSAIGAKATSFSIGLQVKRVATA